MAGSPGNTERRGRRPARPDPASGPVEEFADQLWKLKEEADDPSFAEMSGRLGAAASKSSLAAAARGQVMPSWETTWEFVRVLAVDRLGRDTEETELEWRGRWERARNAALGVTGLDAGDAPPPDPARGKLKRVAAVAALSVAIIAGAGTVVTLARSLTDQSGKATPEPGGKPSEVVGDDSTFEADVTVPDGTEVDAGKYFTKVWRIRNTGTTRWHRRYLTRINSTPCDAPEMVAIRQTDPGDTVDISVKVRAASRPGRCKIYWKMTDEDRNPLLAGKRPIFLDVQVTKS